MTDNRIVTFSSPEDVCPICKSDRYLQPKLKLLVNSSCFHVMCDSCVDRLFSLGPEPCPMCHVTIRRNQFKPILFENLAVEKEVAIRKRMERVFNKLPSEFKDDAAYNDYLEKCEELTQNLINSADVEGTEEKIKQYEKENRDQIELNLERENEERRLTLELEERDRRLQQEKKRKLQELEQEQTKMEQEAKRQVISTLESSTASTDAIVKNARRSTRKRVNAKISQVMEDISMSEFLADKLKDKAKEAEEISFYELPAEDRTYLDRSVTYSASAGEYQWLGKRIESIDHAAAGGYETREALSKMVQTGLLSLFV